MASFLNKAWSGLDFWDKEENKQQRQQFAAPRPQPARAPSQQAQQPQQRPSDFKTGLRMGLRSVGRNARYLTPVTVSSSITHDLMQKTKPTKAFQSGIDRSMLGTGQAFSGLIDLATPGKGTNRVSDYLDTKAKNIDNTVKREKLNPFIYKGAQFAGDTATALVTAGTSKGVQAPKLLKPLAKASNVAIRFITTKTEPLMQAGFKGRVAASTIRNVANPKYQAVNAGYNTLQIGKDASQGKDISKERLVIDNLVGGVAIPAAGAVGSQVAKGAANKVLPKVAKTSQGRSNMYLPGTELNFTSDANGKLKANFHPQQSPDIIATNLKDARQQIADTNAMLLSSQGGYVKTPGAKKIVNGTQAHTQPQPPVVQPKVEAPQPTVEAKDLAKLTTPSSEITIAPAKPKTSAAVPPTPPTPPTQPKLTPPDNGGILPPKNGTMIGGGPTKKQGTTRYARKTVKESEFVSEQIKKDIKSPTYDIQTEKARYTDSLSRLKSEGADNFEVSLNERLQAPNGKISAQDVADAQAYAAMLDMRGDKLSLEKATVIYEKLSEHLTAAGQTIQAAAILSRRSPEGMRYWATKQLNQANVKLTPELQSELNTLIKAAKKAKDKQRATFEVQKFVDSHIPSSLGDRIINLWRAGLLTAPTTTGGNLLGNTGETLVRKGFVNPVATASDALMSMVTGKRTMTLGKAGAGAKGMGEGISTLPEYLRTGYDPRQMQSKLDVKKELNYGNGKLGKALNTYVNGVYRLMGTADAPFSTLAEKEALSSIAKAEAINKGLKGAERSAFVSNFMENPPMAALERAAKEADYATFKNKTKLGQAAAGAKRPLGAVGDFIIPFTQVPASIAMRLIDRTPIGIGKEIVSQIVAHKNGAAFDQRAMAQAIGNGTFGVVAIGAGMALAKTGDLTFGYPTDEKERKLWEMQGKQPYSVKVGNRWYSLNYLQPFGMLLSIGGQAEQDRKEGKNWQETTLASLGRAGQSINEQSFLKGVNTVTSAVADPERSMEKVMDSTAGSLVPNFIGSATRAADPVQRKTGSLADAIKSDIPGLRGQVPEKNDVFGNPIPAKDNFANQYLNPLKPSIARSNTLVDQLAKLQAEGNGVMPTQTKEMGNVKLTKKQQAELNRMSGQLTEAKWNELTQSSDFAALNSDQKKKALSSLGEDANAVQKKQFSIANNLKTGNLTARQRAIAGTYDDPSSYARKAVDSDSSTYSGTFNKRHEPLYKDASKIVPNGLNPLPKNTEVLSLYDQFRLDFGKATNDLKKRDLQKEFISNAYKTDLTSAGRELFSANYNSKQKIDALNRGEISQDELSKAIALDNYLYDNGLSSKRYIPREVRYAFGYSSGGSGGSGGSGSRGRTAKGSKRKSKVTSIVMPTYSTSNRKMQSLLKSTRA